MGDHKEQRAWMKFCFLLEKMAAETIVMLQQAFKDNAFGKSQVYEWFSRFKDGNMSIEDLPRPGRPSTSRNEENIEKDRQAINEDRRKTIEQVSEETNVSWSSCQRILTEDLRMRRVSAKFVPRLLAEEQKDNRVNVCRDLKQELRNGPNFFTNIVTGDESWCYAYDLVVTHHNNRWMLRVGTYAKQHQRRTTPHRMTPLGRLARETSS
jgi:histone-lysine N-methyltransferase SETMAR